MGYTVKDITIPREFHNLPIEARGYLVEYELFEIAQQLRGINLSTKQIFELIAITVLQHDIKQAATFIDTLYLITDKFRQERSVRNAKARHMWVGGYGINTVRKATSYGQQTIYEMLVHWEQDIARGACFTHLTLHIDDDMFLANVDRMLNGLRTFPEYNIRTNVLNLTRNPAWADKTGGETYGQEVEG